MKLIGITGGIGMGKTTAGELLRRQGVAVVDTDLVSRAVVEPGQPALAEIRARFGAEVFLTDGRLDRAQLGKRVFGSSEERMALERILHPRIRERWSKEVAEWRKAGKAFGAVIIPLLFETDAQELFDEIVCVACSEATQAQRLRARGWDEAEAQRRAAAQWPVERKIAQSDFVVWTDTTLEAHAAQWAKIIGGRI